MSDEPHEVFSYDQIPYNSWPYLQSHPDRLATMATLFGMHPQPIQQARILELGCAGGGNLIPMAESLPSSEFVGIDLSERQLSDAVDTTRQLDLSNIEFLHRDIGDVGPELGKFHYVIAHGIYSWVPPDVQQKLLTICHDNLEPHGVAYVSYNTYPGWYMRGMIRQMLVYHARQFENPRKRVEQARALLHLLVDSVSDQDSAYATCLQEEMDLFDRSSDAYLFHDHLESCNEPVFFHEFVSRAESCGLQYLGESHLGVMACCNRGTDIYQTLRSISRDAIQLEQYTDFVRNRGFRQSLLCQDGQELDRRLSPSNVAELYFASSISPPFERRTTQVTDRDIKIESASPDLETVLEKLTAISPLWISFDDLWSAMNDRANLPKDSVATSPAQLGEFLIRCFASNIVNIYASPPLFVTSISERPQASSIARLQACSSRMVTNRKHDVVKLDDIQRLFLPLLDGTNTVRETVDHAQQQLAKEGMKVKQDDGQAIEDPAEGTRLLEMKLNLGLQYFSSQALLVA